VNAAGSIMVVDSMSMTTDAVADIEAVWRDSGREIHGGTARAIASWWASPSGTGEVLGRLSRGQAVDLTDLLDDIAATRPAAETVGEGRDLDVLATWALAVGAAE